MIINCDECSCRNKTQCNLGYTIHSNDMDGVFLPASEDCKLIKIETKDDGNIYPRTIEFDE